MKTSSQLIKEVESEMNAVRAADLGMEAAKAFAQEARNQFTAGDVVKTQAALDNLISLLDSVAKAIPANVTPATAGPVGKSPHEQYLEQASGVVAEALAKLNEAVKDLPAVLAGVREAVNHAATATAAIKSPDLKDRAA